MIIQNGEKVHVILRRAFEGDLRRHFTGVVTATSDAAIRAEGYVFVFNTATNLYTRRLNTRVRTFSLIDANCIINILPDMAAVENVKYVMNKEGRLIVTDGNSFEMDVNEFGHNA